jgi:hypothetical protein
MISIKPQASTLIVKGDSAVLSPIEEVEMKRYDIFSENDIEKISRRP